MTESRPGRPAGAETVLIPNAPAVAELESRREGTVRDGRGGLRPSPFVEGLLVRDGDPARRIEFPLRQGATEVGSESCAIRLTDAQLNDRHFRVEARGNEFFLHDFEGSSGTFLNGYRIRAVKLMSGDRITAGSATFTFSVR